MTETPSPTPAPAEAAAGMPSSLELAAWRDLLAGLGDPQVVVEDAERVAQLRALEEIKNAAAAAQARVTVAFDASQRRQQAAAGLRADKQGLGVAGQVGLARRESPHRAARHLGLAKVLVTEMPCAHAALTAGVLTEWRATLLARETAHLSVEHRAEVDRRLCADPASLDGLGDATLAREARRLAQRLDPAAAVRRARRAENDRRVTLRPAPDTMTYLTGLLPVTHGVAVHAALTRHADTLRARGDARSRGQIMADELVARITGTRTETRPDVEVHLVVTDHTLFAGPTTVASKSSIGRGSGSGSGSGSGVGSGGNGGAAATDPADEPAHLLGYGPIAAPLARALVRDADRAWIRRLFTHPDTGRLVGMDTTRRSFTGGLRQLLIVRDQTCRTPWCDAPIRHSDHAVPVEHGGPTSEHNGQGLCEACNHTKQAPDWHARPSPADPASRHTVEITTPTGHTYRSQAPPLPGTDRGAGQDTGRDADADPADLADDCTRTRPHPRPRLSSYETYVQGWIAGAATAA